MSNKLIEEVEQDLGRFKGMINRNFDKIELMLDATKEIISMCRSEMEFSSDQQRIAATVVSGALCLHLNDNVGRLRATNLKVPSWYENQKELFDDFDKYIAVMSRMPDEFKQ